MDRIEVGDKVTERCEGRICEVIGTGHGGGILALRNTEDKWCVCNTSQHKCSRIKEVIAEERIEVGEGDWIKRKGVYCFQHESGCKVVSVNEPRIALVSRMTVCTCTFSKYMGFTLIHKGEPEGVLIDLDGNLPLSEVRKLVLHAIKLFPEGERGKLQALVTKKV